MDWTLRHKGYKMLDLKDGEVKMADLQVEKLAPLERSSRMNGSRATWSFGTILPCNIRAPISDRRELRGPCVKPWFRLTSRERICRDPRSLTAALAMRAPVSPPP